MCGCLVGVRELDRYEALQPRGPLRAQVVKPVRIDLSSRKSIEDSVAELGDELGRIDVLVNNAGQFTGGLLAETDVEEIYATVQANLTGWLHLTRLVLPQMLARGEGKIVNQSSIVGYAHFPGTTIYGATKAGVSAMTHALRRELDDSGVTTLELITGGYDTQMLESAAEQLSRTRILPNGSSGIPPTGRRRSSRRSSPTRSGSSRAARASLRASRPRLPTRSWTRSRAAASIADARG